MNFSNRLLINEATKTTFYEENSPTSTKALEKQAAREGRRPNQTIEQEILKFRRLLT